MHELELEKSLKHHEDIVDEVECIEKTLLKRRAELREADRLLAEAESELSCTKEKVCSVVAWGEPVCCHQQGGVERKCDKSTVIRVRRPGPGWSLLVEELGELGQVT